MVSVKEMKQSNYFLCDDFFEKKIAELMPGFKSFKIRVQALSSFTHTDVH